MAQNQEFLLNSSTERKNADGALLRVATQGPKLTGLNHVQHMAYKVTMGILSLPASREGRKEWKSTCNGF